MAMIDKAEVTISSGGSVLHEYDAPPDDDTAISDINLPHGRSTVIKYIEAIVGANFEITYSVRKDQALGKATYLAFSTYVDGQKTLSSVVKGWFYQRGSDWKMKPYRWAQLLTTDENPKATVAEVKATYGNLGVIRIDFARKKLLRIETHCEEIALIREAIPEKALKGQAIEVGIGLDDTSHKTKQKSVWHGESVDGVPLATFIFLYRSKNALQILDVIPQTPEPIALEDRDPESLTREELVGLARRRQTQREAEKVNFKKEKMEVNLRQVDAAVKREASDDDEDDISIIAPPSKRTKQATETIDLTDE